MSIKADEFAFIREMFEHIAPRYDFLNRLLSLRQDVVWRRIMVDSLDLPPGALVLDAACGTGDVIIELLRRSGGKVRVVGIDFSPRMLALARPKLEKAHKKPGAGTLAVADVFDLPFGSDCFDAVTMAFGIRNIQNKIKVLEQYYHHLKPGGQLAVLELALPRQGALLRLALLYFNRLLPLIGRCLSRHEFAYAYLPNSMARFPSVGEFACTLQRAGFVDVRHRSLSMGICTLFRGQKPSIA